MEATDDLAFLVERIKTLANKYVKDGDKYRKRLLWGFNQDNLKVLEDLKDIVEHCEDIESSKGVTVSEVDIIYRKHGESSIATGIHTFKAGDNYEDGEISKVTATLVK